ncbi:MAG: helix-turn-helix transcriptional regulator [Steroidobacteraceae bacterium]|nr:helix-turn-helix transcriptional regulator [Steroidobacteraceae bacterium]
MSQLDKKAYRDEFVSAMVSNTIALQIRELRSKANLSQKKLAQKMGKKQSVISRLEDPEYGAFNVRTLLEMAKAFDVALLVKFIPFNELMERSRKLAPEDLAVYSYSDEQRRQAALGGVTITAVNCTNVGSVAPSYISEKANAIGPGVGHG